MAIDYPKYAQKKPASTRAKQKKKNFFLPNESCSIDRNSVARDDTARSRNCPSSFKYLCSQYRLN